VSWAISLIAIQGDSSRPQHVPATCSCYMFPLHVPATCLREARRPWIELLPLLSHVVSSNQGNSVADESDDETPGGMNCFLGALSVHKHRIHTCNYDIGYPWIIGTGPVRQSTEYASEDRSIPMVSVVMSY
jgi:hypothetical protein